MRILQKTYGLTSGGVETLLVNLQKSFPKNIVFDYLTDRGNKEFYDEKIKEFGSRKFSLDTDHISNKVIRTFTLIKRLNIFFQSNKYDILHINESGFQALIIAMVAKKNKVKHIIIHSHIDSNNDKVSASKVLSGLIKIMLPWFTTNYIACSKQAAISMFGKRYVEKNKVLILKNGILSEQYKFNLEIRNKLRSEMNLTASYVIGNVGRLVPQKNQIFLIDLLPKIKKRISNVKLLLVGNGSDKDKLQNRSRELDVENDVIFYGETDDVPSIMNVFDLFLFPSISEGFGIVAIEAQASGLKTIVSKTVPKEIEITSLIEWADLNSKDEWIEKIVNNEKEQIRLDTTKIIIDSGYDISYSAKILSDYYMSLINS